MNNTLKHLLLSVSCIAVWAVAAFGIYLCSILTLRAILGPDTGVRSEVLRLLAAIGIVGFVTIGAIYLLYKRGFKPEAISVSVVATVAGAYSLLLIYGFGGFQLLF